MFLRVNAALLPALCLMVRWSAASQTARGQSVRVGVYTAEQASRGQQQYDVVCFGCHGPTGKGGRGRSGAGGYGLRAEVVAAVTWRHVRRFGSRLGSQSPLSLAQFRN
jgi:mono/diheme cytochrome c family protein